MENSKRREQDRDMIMKPAYWPQWPLLPLKRIKRLNSSQDLGVIVAGSELTLHFVNLFDAEKLEVLGTPDDGIEKKVFNTLDELLDEYTID